MCMLDNDGSPHLFRLMDAYDEHQQLVQDMQASKKRKADSDAK